MYLWKYWRESRIVFGMSMLGIAVLAFLVFRGVWHFEHDSGHFGRPDPGAMAKAVVVSLYMQVPVFAFLAWVMGSFGVGKNLGEDSGSYLLTRPRPRRWFLWRDWGFGFLQLVWAAVLVNLLLGHLVHRLSGAGGGPFSGAIAFWGAVSADSTDRGNRLEFPDHRAVCGTYFQRHLLLDDHRETCPRRYAGSGHHSRLPDSGSGGEALLVSGSPRPAPAGVRSSSAFG